jgi:hypothetical protein
MKLFCKDCKYFRKKQLDVFCVKELKTRMTPIGYEKDTGKGINYRWNKNNDCKRYKKSFFLVRFWRWLRGF